MRPILRIMFPFPAPGQTLTTFKTIVYGMTYLLFLATSNKRLPDPSHVRETFRQSYDYIIVGSGSAGAAVANRLSEDSNISVLLLEAGGVEDEASEIPSYFSLNVARRRYDWNYFSTRQENGYAGLIERRGFVPRGKVLGGTSTINAMMYVRGNQKDYDDWDKLGQTNGLWSWDKVFPYFVRMEDNRVSSLQSNGFHGVNGPITVEEIKPSLALDAFLESGKTLGYGIGDYNAEDQMVFGRSQHTVRDGKRCSTAKGYLRSLDREERDNLDILVNAQVTRVILDENKRATGAVNSPQILMLSGIGDCEHLKSVGIDCLVNLPPVGQNLQDHLINIGMNYFLNTLPIESLTERADIFASIPSKIANGDDGEAPGSGIAFIKTKFANESDAPDIQVLWSKDGLSDYGLGVTLMLNLRPDVALENFGPFAGRPFMSMGAILMRPKSRGSIRLQSSDPFAMPLIDEAVLKDPHDVEVLIDATKKMRQLALSEPFQKLGVQESPILVTGCKRFQPHSDQYYECMIRTLGVSTWHLSGTCAIGTCVDKELRVKGVKGLRVIDASIMPQVTTGNTNAPSIMIGEKGADIILGEKWFREEGKNLKPGKVFHSQ
jgi:choline dehydrogenase-like flavoprotein